MSRPDQAGLLTRVHAGRRSAELITGAGAHLRDHQDIPIARNDVQLAHAAAEIPIENFETLGSEEVRGGLFGGGA